MLLGFDHLIVAVNDIAEADRNYARAGFDVTHRPDAGPSETAIRIICFDDGSYLELFSFRDPGQPSKHRWATLVPRGEGWVDWSLHCDDVEAEAGKLKQHDLPHAGPRTGGKSLLDGRAWKVGVVDAGYGVGNPLMPFFIQDLMLAAPNTHFVVMAQAILFRGAGLDVVWPQFAALLAIGLVMFALALWRFRAFLR